jgi:hypothetical protein
MSNSNTGVNGISCYIADQEQKAHGAMIARACGMAAPITWAGGTGNSILLATMMFPGALVLRTGATGSFTETFDTAAAIIAMYPEMDIGDCWFFDYVNVAAQTLTWTAGSGNTLTGVATNAGTSLKQRVYVTKTSAAALGIMVA